jgi:CDP-glucose 4,6-dehydratase
MSSELEPVVQGHNHGEIQAQYLDSTKANSILNWKPRFGLEEGLRRTINWYLNYFEGKAL